MKELPIIDNPWIQTYQIRNYELGIVQDKTPWIYSKYLNCYYNPDEDDCFNHCVTSGGRFFIKDGALLEQKFTFNKSIISLGLINFIDWVKNFIDHNWYILCYVDEYYIKVKKFYMTRHYRHTLLIYGYDDEAHALCAIGYNKDRKYEKLQIPFEEFELAVNVEFDRKKENYYPRNIEKIEFDIVKINPEYKFEFDIKELYISLSDYIDSVDSFNSKPNNMAYGIECVQKFKNYIVNELNNRSSNLDERYSRLFMELKEIMVRRLEYLVEIEVMPSSLLDEYIDIAKDQEIVHMLFIKYNFTNKEDILLNLISKMQSIIDREIITLPQIRQCIYDYLLNRERSTYC